MIEELVFSLGKSGIDSENELSAYWITGEGLHIQELYRDKLKGEIVITEEGAGMLLAALNIMNLLHKNPSPPLSES